MEIHRILVLGQPWLYLVSLEHRANEANIVTFTSSWLCLDSQTQTTFNPG